MTATQLSKLPRELLTELLTELEKRLLPSGTLLLSFLDPRIKWDESLSPFSRGRDHSHHLHSFAREGCLQHLIWFARYFDTIAPGSEYQRFEKYTRELLLSGREDCLQFVVDHKLYTPPVVSPRLTHGLHFVPCLPGPQLPDMRLSGKTSLDVHEKFTALGLPSAVASDAAAVGNLQLLSKLLERCPQSNLRVEVHNCLQMAARCKQWDTLRWLFQIKTDCSWLIGLSFYGSYDEAEMFISILLEKYKLEEFTDILKQGPHCILLALAKRGQFPSHEILHDCWYKESFPFVEFLLNNGFQYQQCCVDAIASRQCCFSIELFQLVLPRFPFLLQPKMYMYADKDVIIWLESQSVTADSIIDYFSEYLKEHPDNPDYDIFEKLSLSFTQLDRLINEREELGIKAFKRAFYSLSKEERKTYVASTDTLNIIEALCEEDD